MRLSFLLLLFILLVTVPLPCLADAALKDSPPTFSSLKRYPIPDSTIGQKGNTYISPVGSTPSTKFAKTPSGGLGRNLLRFGKFLGKGGPASIVGQFAIGVTANIAVDLGKAYLDKQLQKRPSLLDALDDALGYNNGDFPDGSVSQCPGGHVRVVRSDVSNPFCSRTPPDPFPGLPCSGSPLVVRLSKKDVCADGWYTVERVTYHLEPYDSPANPDPDTDPTIPSRYPDQLNDDQLKDLVDKLDELLQKNDQLANDIADALDDLINENPDYLDWDPIPARDFEDAILQDKINDAIQGRSNTTDPDEIRRYDDLLEQLMNQKNRLDLNRQKEDEDQKKKADKTPDTDNCSDNNNNCNNNNCNNNCNNCPDGKCEVECKIEETPFEPPEVPKPELKEIDFQPITDLQGKLMEKFPFCLLRSFSSALDVLSASPRAPHCEFNLGISTINFDLSFLDGFAAFIRAVMSFCIFGLCGFGLFRMWSRF